HDLLKAALKGDAIEAERLCKTTLEKSLALWKDRKKIKKAGGVINETKIF
ncbi:GntR family transcriptional regulator, partial [Bacillus toyonensis]